MSKKIFMFLFLMIVLMSVSAVSAADLDGNNGTIASSDNMGGELSIASDVDTIGDLNENDADGGDAALENDAGSVTVSKEPTEIIVVNSTLDMFVGDEVDPGVSISPSGAGELDYISSDVGVVVVNGDGTFTAIGDGSANVTIRFMGNEEYAAAESKNISVTVSKIPTEISIANATLEVKMLNITFAGATLSPAEAGNLSYTSNNSNVAIVLNGIVIPVGLGNARITVSFNGNDKYAAAEDKTITVSVGLSDASVIVDNSTLDLKVGDTYAINATTVPSIVKQYNIIYTSSNESVVTVDEKGTVTATGKGKAIITVGVGDGRVFAKNSTEIAVTVDKIDTSDKIVIEGSIIHYGENATVTVVLPDDATGNVTVKINDTPYTAKVNGSITVVEIPGLSMGLYDSLNVTYSGDDKYYGASGMATIEVGLPASSVEIMPIEDIAYPADNVTIEYLVKHATTVIISVYDGDLNLIAYKPTIANVDEFKDNLTVDGLATGDYYVLVYNEGNANYSSSYGFSKFTVNKAAPKIETNITENITAGDEGVAIHIVLPKDAIGRLMVGIDGESINPMGYVLINGTADINIPSDFITSGRHSYIVGYPGDDKYEAVVAYDSFNVAGKTPVISVDCPVNAFVGDNVTVKVNIPNATGTVSVIVDGNETVKPLVDGSAILYLDSVSFGNHSVVVFYFGDEIYDSAHSVSNFTVAGPVPVVKTNVTLELERTYIQCYSIDTGEKSKEYFVATLKDVNGNPIVNATIRATIAGQEHTLTTDKDGKAKLQINVRVATTYSATLVYLGDETHNANMAVGTAVVEKKKTSIIASSKTFKKSTKTKSYTITLKTEVGSSDDGKSHIRNGITVTLQVNGKTFEAKTYSNGKVTFGIDNLNKNGKFVANINYKGDKGYEKSSKKVTLTVN